MMQLGGSCGCSAPKWGDPVGVEILPLSREPCRSLGSVKFLGRVAGDFFTGGVEAPGGEKGNGETVAPPSIRGTFARPNLTFGQTHPPGCPVW